MTICIARLASARVRYQYTFCLLRPQVFPNSAMKIVRSGWDASWYAAVNRPSFSVILKSASRSSKRDEGLLALGPRNPATCFKGHLWPNLHPFSDPKSGQSRSFAANDHSLLGSLGRLICRAALWLVSAALGELCNFCSQKF